MDDDAPSSSALLSPFAPSREINDDAASDAATPCPPSPSAGTFLRTSATLQGLARQLEDLNNEDNVEGDTRCCCGASVIGGSCPMIAERDRLEDKLKISGEIGDALLLRYEALERKHQREVERYEHQLGVKRTALAESVRRVNNLEKANTTHLQKYAEMSRKNEALEKRYTQAMHTQTLTQQSLTHVRAELTSLRATSQRQSLQLVSGAGVEDRLIDAERRYEEARELAEAGARRARDEERRRKRAEARIAELEGQLSIRTKEVEEVREARAKDAQDLLANAKERLTILHAELSETFRAESPSEAPEYQRTLEALVANNALLKHDASELSHLLTDSREEVRILRDEIDELRAAIGVARRSSPDRDGNRRHLASELSQSHAHARTESSPNVGSYAERAGWARMSVHVPNRAPWDQNDRKSFMAPSWTSASTSTNADGGLPSPGLGMGQIGEYGGGMVRDDSNSGAPSPSIEGRESPNPVFRSSSSGIGYVLNGVPKNKVGLPRPIRRSFSERPRSIIRPFSPQRVDRIAEWVPHTITGHGTPPRTDDPLSPASDYFRAAEASRKRRSPLLSRADTLSLRDPGEYSPNASNTLLEQSDLPSPMSDGALMSHAQEQRVHRRTLLLLTRSTGTQTDPVVDGDNLVNISSTMTERRVKRGPAASITSSGIPSSHPHADGSETSSLHENRNTAGVLTVLIEHLMKILTKLQSADIPTLNKRLKKHHLSGGVEHLSRSTMRALQLEVTEMRQTFRGVFEVNSINRREFSLLLKLLKDVFIELIELQSVVNDVTIDPHFAKTLQREAYRDDEEGDGKGGNSALGLGWIAAPITKFFVTSAADGSEGEDTKDSRRPGRMAERRLQPGTMKAPKLQASTSATTTHVSVEFGGSGIVRRSTPAVPATTAVEGSPQLSETASDSASQVHGSTNPETTMIPPSSPTGRGTLRPSKSRANRNELLGIFAGAPRPISPTGWVVLGQGTAPGGPSRSQGVRAASSQYFGDRTVRQRDDAAAASRKRLSAVVDAVIDTTAEQMEGENPATASTFETSLLERQLRPRGLSDSSIRSTFISHGNPSKRLITASSVAVGSAPRATAQGVSGGYFGNLAGRLYTFRGAATSGIARPIGSDSRASTPVPDRRSTPDTPGTLDGRSPPTAKPIPTSPLRPPSRAGATSPTATSSPGLLGMLANSLVSGAQEGMGERNDAEEDEPEMRNARLRTGMGPGVGGRSMVVKDTWR